MWATKHSLYGLSDPGYKHTSAVFSWRSTFVNPWVEHNEVWRSGNKLKRMYRKVASHWRARGTARKLPTGRTAFIATWCQGSSTSVVSESGFCVGTRRGRAGRGFGALYTFQQLHPRNWQESTFTSCTLYCRTRQYFIRRRTDLPCAMRQWPNLPNTWARMALFYRHFYSETTDTHDCNVRCGRDAEIFRNTVSTLQQMSHQFFILFL
jgi:hypothetical protein